MTRDGAKHDATDAQATFAVVGAGRLSDASIEALARLLIDIAELENDVRPGHGTFSKETNHAI